MTAHRRTTQLAARVVFASALALAGCAAPRSQPLAPADQEAVDEVQAWLDGLHNLTARFVQVWPDGAVGEGTARFDPPGHLRLDYEPPGSTTLVANGGRIVFTDARTGAVTRMAASASPLGLLLADHVRLGGAIRVTSVQRAPGALQLSLARADDPGQGLLTLTFAEHGALELTGIEAVDGEGHRTRFHLTDEHLG